MTRSGGGLLNLHSYGLSNILIYGNPQKSLFFKTYKSITNFGIQRFRLDSIKDNEIKVSDSVTIEYEIKRYAQMVGDCYLVVNLPDVYSPIYKYEHTVDGNIIKEYYAPEFRWVDELGVNMIREVEVQSGGQTISRYTGEYFSILAHRDNRHKYGIWKEMVGHVPELTNPLRRCPETGSMYYPNAIYDEDAELISGNIEPSIRGRKLYIPLDMWFCRDISDALPLVATQYAPISIRVQLRPLSELYVVRERLSRIDSDGKVLEHRKGPYIAPNLSIYEHHPHRFFNQPASGPLEPKSQTDAMHPKTKLDWKTDIHVMSTYYFLSDEELKVIAQRVYKRLILDVYNYTITNIYEPTIRRVYSSGLVASYTFRLRRSDVNKRNEWFNYTNRSQYNYTPKSYNLNTILSDTDKRSIHDNFYYYSGGIEHENQERILDKFNIIMDGIERENDMDMGVVQYIEPYARSRFYEKHGMYEYNFTTDTNTRKYQPCGGMNMDKFGEIMFKIETILPPRLEGGGAINICDDLENIIGSNKRNPDLYEYTYEMEVYEERYNTLTIRSGNIGLLFAR